MDSVLPSVDSTAKSSGLTGLLSSLGSVFNTSALTSGDFARFLEQDQGTDSSSVKSVSTNAASQTAGVENGDSSPLDTGSFLNTLKTAVSDLRHVLRQMNNNNGDTKASSSQTQSSDVSHNGSATDRAFLQKTRTQNRSAGQDAQDQNDGSGNTANAAVTGGANAVTGSVTKTSIDPPPVSGSGGASAENGNDSDANDTLDGKTIAQLMSELMMLAQSIEKKLTNGQTSATGDGANAAVTGLSTGSTQPANPADSANNSALAGLLGQTGLTTDTGNSAAGANPSSTTSQDGQQASAADPLTQLLSLIQSIEQKLAPASSNISQTGDPAATANSTSALSSLQTQNMPVVFPDLTRIQKDLKGLITSLQNATANNNPQANPASGDDAGSIANAQNTGDSALPAGALLKTGDMSQSPQMPPLVGDLFNLFADRADGVSGNLSAPNNMTPATTGLTAAAQNGLLDTNTQNDSSMSSDSNTGNTGSLMNNTPLPTLPDGTKAADPYAFASQLSASRALTGGMTGLPSAVEQVILQLNRSVKNGNDQMTIQLQPGDLGKINIKLDIAADGKVQGTVVADNPATLNTLLKDVRSLERALQEAGLRADPGSLQFSLGGQSGNPGQTANNSGNGSPSDNSNSSGSAGTSLDMTADAGEAWIISPGRVNLKV